MTGIPDIMEHCFLYAMGEVYGVNPVVDRIVNNVTAEVYGVTAAIDEVLDGVDYDAPLKDPFTVETEFEKVFGELLDDIDYDKKSQFNPPSDNDEEEKKDDEEEKKDDIPSSEIQKKRFERMMKLKLPTKLDRNFKVPEDLRDCIGDNINTFEELLS